VYNADVANLFGRVLSGTKVLVSSRPTGSALREQQRLQKVGPAGVSKYFLNKGTPLRSVVVSMLPPDEAAN
jgi:hypothetical protein